ncbi:MAG TPA: gamma-glutamylcyclotransferase family protein [Thermoanaerobaculia bacterium]|nr:gamma-glutamylcyclotransferase family protein [Thermoanaerobaculia bacterium]
MEPRRIPVFFYGMFMDAELLRGKGADPRNIRPATVDGYALRIGERAALVPEAGSRVYGLLMDLSHADLDLLYAEPSVNMYRAEPLLCASGGATIPVVAFNLPAAPSPEESNAAYAEKLRDLARRLQLPAEYIERIH